MYVAYNFLDFDMPELKNPVDRVVYTLKWHGLSAAVLFNMFEVNAISSPVSVPGSLPKGKFKLLSYRA